jgi:hypothetical protein
MSEPKTYDRRSDVGSKVTTGIVTAILTSVFLGALGMSIRQEEKGHLMDVRIVKVEVFIANQDRLNERLVRVLEHQENKT